MAQEACRGSILELLRWGVKQVQIQCHTAKKKKPNWCQFLENMGMPAPDDLRYVGVRQREGGTMFLGIITSNGKVGPTTWVLAGVISGPGTPGLVCHLGQDC